MATDLVAGLRLSSFARAGRGRRPICLVPHGQRGIGQVGIELRIEVERAIEQPAGEVQTWRWSGSEDHPLRLLALEKSIATISVAKEDSSRPEDGQRYFVAADGLSDDDYSVRFWKLALGQEADEQDFSLEIAPGDVTLSVREFLGRPEPDALRSLGLDEDSGIWLKPTLHGSSAWVPRILDLEGWERGTGFTLAKKTLALEPGGTAEVRIRSPRWSWWPTAVGEHR